MTKVVRVNLRTQKSAVCAGDLLIGGNLVYMVAWVDADNGLATVMCLNDGTLNNLTPSVIEGYEHVSSDNFVLTVEPRVVPLA